MPPIDVFTDLWMKRYASEKHLEEPMSPRVQLVLGLFTVAQDVEYREIVRKTWLQQTGVCYWQRAPKEGCSVYVAFAIGKSGMGQKRRGAKVAMSPEEVERTHGEPGMLVLDSEENMNINKSPTWFRSAVEMFPWATHVGKTDMDTYPFLHKLVNRIDKGRSCSRHFSQYEVIGRPHKNYGNVSVHACPYNCAQFTSEQDDVMPFAKPVAKLNEPWKYLSGEFYVFSMNLAQKINWDWSGGGNEDVEVFSHVTADAANLGQCIMLRRLDSWFHRNKMNNETFANDMRA